jgi:hypothetical protein
MSNTDLTQLDAGDIIQQPCLLLGILSESLLEYCFQFITIANFMRLCKVNRFFRRYMSVINVRSMLCNSFHFVNYNCLIHSETLSIGLPDRLRVVKGTIGRHVVYTTDISTFNHNFNGRSNGIAVMVKFDRWYNMSVEYGFARAAIGLMNNWILNEMRTLQPLRFAGIFSSRSVRRYLVNHLRRFFTGGGNEANSMALQLVCDDEMVGVSHGISAEMGLLPEITFGLCEVKSKHCQYVQYIGALLTRSYGISYMSIDPVFTAPVEGRDVTDFFIDVTQTDVEALNEVFAELYPGFVAVRFD